MLMYKAELVFPVLQLESYLLGWNECWAVGALKISTSYMVASKENVLNWDFWES